MSLSRNDDAPIHLGAKAEYTLIGRYGSSAAGAAPSRANREVIGAPNLAPTGGMTLA